MGAILWIINSPLCSAEEILCGTYSDASGPKYKGVVATYCGGYLLKEFDLTAKAKGNIESDWTQKMASPSAIADWPMRAKEKGWAVNMLAGEPYLGAIGVKVKVDGTGTWHRWYIVRGISDDGLLVSLMEGIPGRNDQRLVVTRKVKASTLSSSKDEYFWQGWIYPVKGDAHALFQAEVDKR